MSNPNPNTEGLDPSHLRPAKPGERRAAKEHTMSAREAFRLYPEEKDLIAAAVAASGIKKNEWIRTALVNAARDQLG